MCREPVLTWRSAFYPSYISVVSLLQSLHFGGALNHKRRCACLFTSCAMTELIMYCVGRKYFWIVVRMQAVSFICST